MSRTPEKVYQRRIEQLLRRRDFLDKRIINYVGKDASYDKAEASAIDWALKVIGKNYISAIDCIRDEPPREGEKL